MINKFQLLLSILILIFLSSCHSNLEIERRQKFSSIEDRLLPPVIIEDSLVQFRINSQLEKYKVKGASIAVIDEGEIIWNEGFGLTNEYDSVSTYTMFQAGSISKPIAALAALKLVSEGKIDLDTDINEYLSSWTLSGTSFDSIHKITLRKLLSHTAGINVSSFSGYQSSDSIPTLNEILNGEASNKKIELVAIPGVEWNYSGGGYAIIQKIIEDVTNEPYYDFLKREILNPLKMDHTRYLFTSNDSTLSVSAGFVDGQILNDNFLIYYQPTAAGLWSTSQDLAKFCLGIQNIISGDRTDLISRDLADEMMKKNLNDWGLGFQLKYAGDSLMFQHDGNTKGFTASLKAFVGKKKGVVVMTNADMEQNLIPEIIRTVAFHYEWSVEEPVKVDPIKLTKKTKQLILGEYEYENELQGGGKYIVKIKENATGKLYFDDGNVEAELLALSEHQLVMYRTGRKFSFVKEGDNYSSFILDNMFKFLRTH